MSSSKTAPRVSHVGSKKPRLYTKPLRKLTPKTSLGFEVIEFALLILGVKLYPWQEWLLIHALELNPDGTYRFRRVIVLVARQNGKSLLASVLAAWWLFVDSDRHPDRLPPVKFQILGTAQNLDTARDVWQTVRMWCDPDADPADDDVVIPALQEFVRRVSDTNGKEEIILKSKVRYMIRAASRKSGRGKSSPRTLMDEMREQLDWTAWDSISQTSKAMYSPQLWGFSNAGDARSVVLNHQRIAALQFIENWETWVEAGLQSAEEFANGHDTSLGLFEWSAPDGCELDDIPSILQANPSIGYGEITVASVLADIEGMTDSGYRTEVLCQWVTSLREGIFPPGAWERNTVPIDMKITDPVVAVDVRTGMNQSAAIVVAGGSDDDYDLVHVVRYEPDSGQGIVDEALKVLAERGLSKVVVDKYGENLHLIPLFEDAGIEVIQLDTTDMRAGAVAFTDALVNNRLKHKSQAPLNLAVQGAGKQSSDAGFRWSQAKSITDITTLRAATAAWWVYKSGITSDYDVEASFY